jgi:membrane protease YdiL (CAAX protease family)
VRELLNIFKRLIRQRVPIHQVQIRNPKRESIIFCGYAFFFIFASLCTGLLIRAYPLPILGAASFTQDLSYDLFFKFILLLAVPYAIYRKLDYRFEDLPAVFDLRTRGILSCVFAFIAGNILNLKHLEWIGEVLPDFTGSQIAIRLVAGAILPLITAGFPEEFVYRGILQTRIEKVWGRFPAILFSTAVFTAWHIPTRYLLSHGIEGQAGNFTSVALGTGVPVFVVGLIFSVLWDHYRKFWPLVFAHWGIDFLPALSSLFGIEN